MPTILLETPINAAPEICYKLSLNVDLHKISTSKTGESIVGGISSGEMKLGDSVTWKAKHFGVWQTLTTKITFTEPYYCFVDEMTQGAFKLMRHEHHFDTTTTGTLMRDVFCFESPCGLVGKLISQLILKNYMRAFLTERNQIIKKVAESELRNQFI